MRTGAIAAAALVAGALIWALLAPHARADEERALRGWTVTQGDHCVFYGFKEEWQSFPNQAGITLRNTCTNDEVLYYGTFRVEYRHKDE